MKRYIQLTYDAKFPPSFTPDDLVSLLTTTFISVDDAIADAVDDINDELSEMNDEWPTFTRDQIVWLTPNKVGYAVLGDRVFVIALHEREFPDDS